MAGKEQREFKWLPLKEAAEVVQEPKLGETIRLLARGTEHWAG
jgi:hypothetical protein